MGHVVGGVDVSRETYAALAAFGDLVRKWTPKINLIAKNTIDQIWDRHIVDSAQLYSASPTQYQTWVDLGSGSGFPGIVMATIAREYQPHGHFTLIESDQRKATFLRTAIRELSLNAEVIAARIEDAPSQAADVVSARALAPLPQLLPLVHRHLAPSGCALLHKGRGAAVEIASARATWSFALEERPSLTDPGARLLSLTRIAPRGT